MDLLPVLNGIIRVLERPVVPLFLGVGAVLTIKTGFLQFRAFPKLSPGSIPPSLLPVFLQENRSPNG